MQLNKLEKIQILLKLVQKYYCDINDIRYLLKATVDLAYVIEHIKLIPTSFTQSEDFIKKHKFLQLVHNTWPKILSDLNKDDIFIHSSYNNNSFSQNNNQNSDVEIFYCNSEYEEVNCAFNLISKFKHEKLTIICPNQYVLKLLQLKFKFHNLHANYIIPYYKYYSCVSQQFKEQVSKYFPEDYRICEELSFLDNYNTHNNTNITITDLRNLTTLKDSSRIFLLDLDYTSFQFPLFGKYWANPTVPNPESAFHYIISQNKKTYLFYSSNLCGKSVFKSSTLSKFEILNHKKLKITAYTGITDHNTSNPSVISNNISENITDNPDAIFNNLSENITGNPNGISNNVGENITDNPDVISNNVNENITDNPDAIFNNLSENINDEKLNYEISTILHASDLTNLIYNPDAFYIRSILKLKPEPEKSDIMEISQNFKEVFYQYFNNNLHQMNYYLEQIKNLDVLYFEKCQQIVKWLKTYSTENTLFNNKILTINYRNKILKAHFDRVEIDNNQIKIIKYQLTSNFNTRNILIGKESTLLAQCCILYRHISNQIENDIYKINTFHNNTSDRSLDTSAHITTQSKPYENNAMSFIEDNNLPNDKTDIQISNKNEYNLEIWYPNWKSGQPIIRKSIPVSQSVIDNYFNLIQNVLHNASY